MNLITSEETRIKSERPVLSCSFYLPDRRTDGRERDVLHSRDLEFIEENARV